MFAPKYGKVILKDPRFIIKSSKHSANKIILGNCTYSGEIGIGYYVNKCTAFDSDLETTGDCTYTITVKEKSCPLLPPVSNATIQCRTQLKRISYPILPDTLCDYVCNKGYVIPMSQKKWKTNKCLSNLQWKYTSLPSCQKAIPPSIDNEECSDQVIFAETDGYANLYIPKFTSSLKNGKVNVTCSLENKLPVGNYTNLCEALDMELQLSTYCEYNVIVAERSCSPLPSIENASLRCKADSNRILTSHIPGTICEYVCDDGFVIPMSLRKWKLNQCLPNLQWKHSSFPSCIEAIQPTVQNDGCENQTLMIGQDGYANYILPKFKSYLGNDVKISCSLERKLSIGNYTNLCEAFDPELELTAQCKYTVVVQGIPCELAHIPNNVKVKCSKIGKIKRCMVLCDNQHSFPRDFKLLHNGWIECSEMDGQWDFQKMYNITHLPECLGELKNTSVKVWMSFLAFTNCSEDIVPKKRIIKATLWKLNKEMCDLVNCNASFTIECSEENVLFINWTIQAAFDPDEYINSNEVPPVEIQMETILEKTQKAITAESAMKDEFLLNGLGLIQSSYERGHFQLVCEKAGYVVNGLSDKCIQCSSGTYEENGICNPCKKGYFQLRHGQTRCLLCPENTEVFDNNIPLSCLNKD